MPLPCHEPPVVFPLLQTAVLKCFCDRLLLCAHRKNHALVSRGGAVMFTEFKFCGAAQRLAVALCALRCLRALLPLLRCCPGPGGGLSGQQ